MACFDLEHTGTGLSLEDAGNKAAQILLPFRLGHYRIRCEAVSDLSFGSDYLGSPLRGGFGHAFRRAVCPMKRTHCTECSERAVCVYANIFETSVLEADAFMRKSGDAPRPFIIRPPQEQRTGYGAGEGFNFEFVLIGKAMEYLIPIVHAFVIMGRHGIGQSGKRGQFKVLQVAEMGLEGGRQVIYSASDQNLVSANHHITQKEILDRYCHVPPRVSLNFLTRLELRKGGRRADIGFGVLFRRLQSRIASLAHLHCDIDCSEFKQTIFPVLSRAADRVETIGDRHLPWESGVRYSNRQKRRMPFGGTRGQLTFEGDLSPFWPFLLLGQWVHLGKKTTFGFGRYVIETKN